MLRIGVIVNPLSESAWVKSALQSLQASDFIEVALVVVKAASPLPARAASFSERVQAHWTHSVFRSYEQWDYQKNRAENDAFVEQDLTSLLSAVPHVVLSVAQHSPQLELSEEDLASIKQENLDVLVNFGPSTVDRSVLTCLRYGLWSLYHGDSHHYRGGPPCFWEIYEKNPVSGSGLQIMTDSLDEPRVIYQSHSSTRQTSLYLTRNPIYWKTAEFLLRRLSDLHLYGMGFIESLESYQDKSQPVRSYKNPNALQMIRFAFAQVIRRVVSKHQIYTRGGRKQWSVSLRRSTSARFENTTGYLRLRSPADRYYADPILVLKNGKTYLFFEDFRYANQRACISCAEIRKDGSCGEPVEVLHRPYHLSYPYVFEHRGEMYMVPETLENNTVEIYRASNFPHEWTLAGTLLSAICAVDATIEEVDGKLWLFVGTSNGKYGNSDELSLYSADDLLGPWSPHPANPVISDVRRARPAGPLFYQDGKLIRPSQDCGRSYGYALNFSEITVLTESTYKEKLIAQVAPDWADDILGTHTYSRSGDFEAIDGKIL